MGAGPAGPQGAFSQQYPRIDLPGAEYFSLAPNRTIAINARISQKFNSTSTSIPASGVVGLQVDMPLIPQWGPGQGIYIVRIFTIFIPVDTSQKLQITAARMGLGSGSAAIYIDLGIPVFSFPSPSAAQQLQNESQSLFTFRDMTSVGFPPGPLILTSSTTVTNTDAGAAHSASIQLQAIYHMLNGIVE